MLKIFKDKNYEATNFSPFIYYLNILEESGYNTMSYLSEKDSDKIVLTYDNEKIEILDDCMSFPNLLVKVMRYKRCVITYMTPEWKERRMELEGGLSELLQHEYDHLDGILATMRAINNQSFVYKKEL